jgi:hypothetical protein
MKETRYIIILYVEGRNKKGREDISPMIKDTASQGMLQYEGFLTVSVVV